MEPTEQMEQYQSRRYKGIAGFGLSTLTSISLIVQSAVVIDYYTSKKDYLISHPEKINIYLETAENHARDSALVLGLFWGTTNLLLMVGASYLLMDDKNKKPTKNASLTPTTN